MQPYLDHLPSPVPVLGLVGEPPEVHVALHHLGPQDVVALAEARGHGLAARVKAERLGAQLGVWGQTHTQLSLPGHHTHTQLLSCCPGWG